MNMMVEDGIVATAMVVLHSKRLLKVRNRAIIK